MSYHFDIGMWMSGKTRQFCRRAYRFVEEYNHEHDCELFPVYVPFDDGSKWFDIYSKDRERCGTVVYVYRDMKYLERDLCYVCGKVAKGGNFGRYAIVDGICIPSMERSQCNFNVGKQNSSDFEFYVVIQKRIHHQC